MSTVFFRCSTVLGALGLAVSSTTAYAADEIYARKKPVGGIDISINGDHTYVATKDKKGKIRTYSNVGTDSGGEKMDSTSKKGDRDWVKCVYEARNKECRVVWGRNGTCHQSTNLMLAGTNEKLSTSEVRGYSLTKAIYGKYGRPMGSPGDEKYALGDVCLKRCQ